MNADMEGTLQMLYCYTKREIVSFLADIIMGRIAYE